MATTQRVSATAITALKEALTAAFWFKNDLYNYAKAAVAGEPQFLSGIDWTGPQYKRDSVGLFVDRLVREQDEHQDVLIALIVDVANLNDFPQLRDLEDADEKLMKARAAVARLKKVAAPYEAAMATAQEDRERFDAARVAASERRATTERLGELMSEYMALLSLAPQARGYALEKLLAQLFEIFDLEPIGAFKVEGEQIDGGFKLDGEYLILEAKWQGATTARDDLDIFSAKVNRRGDNTLGLFVSINGFQPTAVEIHSGNRSPIFLMDGADLYAVLDNRIDLRKLLRRKRAETSKTGKVLLTAAEILGGEG